MRKYYTRPCNFYYGNYSRYLIKIKKALPLAGNTNISFDQLEIFQRTKKKGVKSSIYSIKSIKTLSNQKFAEFTKKMPDISFGILTGDIKLYPDAQCLIMTTEILRNLLYNKDIQIGRDDDGIPIKVSIDVEEDVSSVIFDEVHYINDKDRGKVWEESLIMLLPKIQLVLLSATLDKGADFAEWITNMNMKPIHYVSTQKRVVPLTHYYYYDTGKVIKNLDTLGSRKKGIKTKKKGGMRKAGGKKEGTRTLGKVSDILVKKYKGLPKLIDNVGDKFVEIQSSTGVFNTDTYLSIVKLQRDIGKVRTHQKSRSFTPVKAVLNNFAKKLQQNKLTPALFFVFSRKKCEQYAKDINHYLNDAKEQIEVSRILTACLHKLDDPSTVSSLKKYHMLEELAKKGIAVHHSGLVPVMKEMIEILFSKGLIKLLFATETFAVGVNMPTKTVIFTGLTKYDGIGSFRQLQTHEYLQMSGRAGRRGLDKKGTVILFGNLLKKNISSTDLKTMMCGKSQSIKSKFYYHYPLVLKGILSDSYLLTTMVSKSLFCKEQQERLTIINEEIVNLESSIESIVFHNEKDTVNEYSRLLESFKHIKHKSKKKRCEKSIHKLETLENIKLDLTNYRILLDLTRRRTAVIKEKGYHINQLETEKYKVIQFLQNIGCIQDSVQPEDVKVEHVTPQGVMASQINECNSILLSKLITSGALDDINPEELISLLALFIDTKPVSEDMTVYNPDSLNLPKKIIEKMKYLSGFANYCAETEYDLGIEILGEWDLHLSMVQICYDWACGEDFKSISYRLPTFEGNFVKDMLKIHNLALEVGKAAEIIHLDELVRITEKVERLVIRGIVSTDSLYLHS